MSPRLRPLRLPLINSFLVPHPSPRAIFRRSKADMANIPVNKTAHAFNKVQFEALLNRRFFYAPAFEIYGGTLRVFPSPASVLLQRRADVSNAV